MSANGAREVGTTVVSRTPAEPCEHAAVLAAVEQTALRLLGGVARPPATLRVQAGAVTLELGWLAQPAPAAPPGVPEAPAPHDDPPVVAPAGTTANGLDHIHAPTVGVFYRASEPGAAPFVEEGSIVVPGQRVAIVEAMKLMIPVEVDRHCRIAEILVPDATAVEFGQRLFGVLPVDAK